MTAIWGPLGWMTLHSVASVYPEQPTQAEKQLMSVWLELFRDTITCHHCRSHFTEMYDLYRQKFPGMLSSRQEFMAFSFRAHNAVNRRLGKPIYNSVAECMETLRNNVKTRSAREYRTAYINHIRRYWRTMTDVAGMVAVKKINQMSQIETDYFLSRDTNFEVDVEETLVVLPHGVIEKVEKGLFSRMAAQRPAAPAPTAAPTAPAAPARRIPQAGFRITAAGLRLR